MKKIIDNIASLIDLKSIITLIVVIFYTILVFKGVVEADYKELVLIVLTYYFARKPDENKQINVDVEKK